MPDYYKMRVECYAGSRRDEEPRRIVFDDRTVAVVSIEERWRTPRARGFRVTGDDERTYVLTVDGATGRWSVEAQPR